MFLQGYNLYKTLEIKNDKVEETLYMYVNDNKDVFKFNNSKHDWERTNLTMKELISPKFIKIRYFDNGRLTHEDADEFY